LTRALAEHFENIHSTLQHLYAALWRTTEIIHQNGAEVLNVEANKVTAKEQEKGETGGDFSLAENGD
jgi:hypothetical protein